MSSLLQKKLRNGQETIETLEERYDIAASRHPAYPFLVQFKYNQINSPMGEKLVQESRGIILDEKNDWECVARPFSKFFNQEEAFRADIDWNSARVQEKLDGSLCYLYYYDNQWHVATTGTPNAGGDVNGNNFTFKELFWKTWEQLGYGILYGHFGGFHGNPEYTYMFELQTMYNRVVIQHKEPLITLIGVRHNKNGGELNINSSYFQEQLSLPIPVRTFGLKNLDEIYDSMHYFNGLEQERYVVVDKDFNRVKIKHPDYLKIHHTITNLNTKRILDIVRKGETLEVLSYFPEWKTEFDKIQIVYDNFIKEMEDKYNKIKHIENQKEFAIEAIKYKNSGALFEARKGINFKQYFKDCHLDKLMILLRLKKENKCQD